MLLKIKIFNSSLILFLQSEWIHNAAFLIHFLFFVPQSDIQALREKKMFQLVFNKHNKSRAQVISTFRKINVS